MEKCYRRDLNLWPTDPVDGTLIFNFLNLIFFKFI